MPLALPAPTPPSTSLIARRAEALADYNEAYELSRSGSVSASRWSTVSRDLHLVADELDADQRLRPYAVGCRDRALDAAAKATYAARMVDVARSYRCVADVEVRS